MAQFSVNAERLDPYKNYKFQVFWADGKDPVAGVSKFSVRAVLPNRSNTARAIARPA